MGNEKHQHLKLKICVSGAAETGHCGDGAMEKAQELGRQIVLQGAILVTGATTGFPFWSTMGAKEGGGVSVGLSPAANPQTVFDLLRLFEANSSQSRFATLFPMSHLFAKISTGILALSTP